ncbi:MAG: hypothetical protein Q7T04_07085 [Dehalococcoidia bacterium]|nr:hypothetical protein [Dehalococcoidia bacterium]
MSTNPPPQPSSTRIAEVIEARSGEFTAECYQLHQAPPLGSLVKAGSPDVFGVVCDTVTESVDPGRRPLARGQDAADEADVYLQNPQLSKLLRTTFRALVVGHREGETLRHYLPPQPPHVHSFVYLCPPDEVRAFTQSLDFLSILMFSAERAPVDEVVAACLRQAAQAHPDRKLFLVGAGKTLAPLLRGELARLNTILTRIRP